MKAATERKLIRWMHILFSIPVVGYIYGPVAQLPVGSVLVKCVMFPAIVLSGLWLWKGHLVKKWFRQRNVNKTNKAVPLRETTL